MNAPVLESERLILRPISLTHLSTDYLSWLNDPEVYRYMERGGDYTFEELEKFLTDLQGKPILFWGIHLKSSGLHLGNIKIDPVSTKHGYGEYGIMMGRKSEWGKGYAREATRRVIDFCFAEIKLRKINLGVVTENSAAVILYKKLGFEIEGTYKKHVCYDGKFYDLFRMALFNPEVSYE